MSLDGRPIEVDAIERMKNAMVHRGPDGDGTWISADGTVGLGHRRLSIIDLSPNAAQPMSNESGSVQLTFNGEIYNYPGLRNDLIRDGYDFRSRSDTEVLLRLYEKKGHELFADLDGDFGFGIWDEEKKRLLVGRDPAGVKPLYYARTQNHFVFASELRSILASGIVAPEINPEALYHYLTFLVSPAPETLIAGVRKLPIGSALTLYQPSGTQKEWRYWEPLPGQYAVDKADLDGQFEDLYTKSVKKRMLSDVPVGVLFSGGVDSTLNAAKFKEVNPDQAVHTFNVGIKDSEYEGESHFASEMAKILGTTHHEVQISLNDVLESQEILTRVQDEPISDPVCIPLYFVTKLAREHGTIVLQAGEGADELFCGYDNYMRFLRHEENLWQPLSRLPRIASSILHSGASRLGSNPKLKKISDVLRRRGLGQEFFMSSAIAYYESEKQEILSRESRSAQIDSDSYSLVEPLYQRIRNSNPNAGFMDQLAFIELNIRLPELLLMRADKISMANSIEVRVPFLDQELIEFAMSVPNDFKIRDGVPKEPVKRLASRYAPSTLR